MDEPVLVRELEPHERDVAASTRTGDLLPDGSVLLRTTDMERMGLEGLRDWLFDHAFRNRMVIAMLTDTRLPWNREATDDGVDVGVSTLRMQTY